VPLPRCLLGLFHALTLGVLLIASTPSGAALQAIPALTSPVTDLTQTLSPDQQQALAAKLVAFEQEKGSQIAVLIVPTTQPEDIAQFSIRLVDAWKIGREKQDDGVLLLVAKNDRKVRIEVGRGLEGAIPDIYAKRIITEFITPPFKQGDYYGGLSAGTDKLMALIAGEQLPAPERASSTGMGIDSAIGLFLMACIFVGSFFTGILGRFFGSAATGGVVGGLSGLLFGLASGATVGLLAFVFTLFIPGLFGGGATSSGRRSGGGYYGGGGGWGGGSSGWGGGGGTFGGGGASGDW